MIDYLDKPPQRYKHEFQKACGSREMVEDAEGEWVKFQDMDLYMFEGAQFILEAMPRIRKLEAALRKIAGNDRVPNDSRIFDKAQYRAGYVAGWDAQADIAKAALTYLETGSAANATAPGGSPIKPDNGMEPGVSDGDFVCPAALPSSTMETAPEPTYFSEAVDGNLCKHCGRHVRDHVKLSGMCYESNRERNMVNDKELAAIIASEIFAIGKDRSGEKVSRIQFMIGRNPERPGAGYGERPLADFIELVLNKHRAAATKSDGEKHE